MSLATPGRSALFLSLSLMAAAAQATDNNLYLQLGGSPIFGESTGKGHVGAINLDSLQWRVTAASSLFSGGGGVGKAVAGPVEWTQGLDRSVTALSLDMLTGKSRPTGSFDLVKPRSLSGTPWLSLKTTDQFMTGLDFTNDTVAASAVAKTFSLSYNPGALNGGAGNGTAVSATWDVTKNTFTGPAFRSPTLPVNGNGPAAASGSDLSMYLRLGDGPANFIAGDSTRAGYENWIELNSAQWGMSAETSFLKGTGAAVGRASVSEFTYTLGADATLLPVLARIVKGVNLPQATIEYVKAGPTGPNTVMQLNLKTVFFTDLLLSTAADHSAHVSESISFRAFSQTVWAVNANGTRGAASSVCYDFATLSSLTCSSSTAPSGTPLFGAGNLAAALVIKGQTSPAGAMESPTLPGPAALVPEAQTWAMMLAGLAGLLAVARRRRAAA